MKTNPGSITSVHAYLLSCPLNEPLEFSFGQKRERATALVEVRTRNGLSGWGEANWGGTAAGGKAFLSLVEERVKPLLRGRDPFHAERIWQELDQLDHDANRVSAAGAVDTALYDLMGRSLGKPLYDLLGGAWRLAVPVYASDLMIIPVRALERRARVLAEKGFRGVKMRIGRAPHEDPGRVALVRRALGPNIKLFADANGRYDRAQALKVGRALEAFGLEHLEEPLPKWDIEGCAELSRKIGIPIAAGECAHLYHMKELLARGAAQVIQPDATVNGLTETRKILALAQAYRAQVVMHNFEAGVGLAAMLHAAASSPLMAQLQELDTNPSPFRDELLTEPIALKNGSLAVPRKPGLGVEINRKTLKKYLIGFC
ncbi:MAG: mandelate racemase/muconate lactonizing enzyme family protein [Elusimicrobia bacterium]|nr:mandelate racemase/muconate lactonizing enzyme family protein [Elusimicrobiota bacterium]